MRHGKPADDMDVGYLVLHQMAHLDNNGLARMLEAKVDKLHQMMEQLEVQFSHGVGQDSDEQISDKNAEVVRAEGTTISEEAEDMEYDE